MSCTPCEEAPVSTADCETLPSALDNFITNFFGSVEKTVVDGVVTWVLPCDLATGIDGNPRLEGEGLACYFLRLLGNGLSGLQGEQGEQGAAGTNGTDGGNAYSNTTAAFTQPSEASPNFNFLLDQTDWVSVGQVVFIAGSGWHTVTAKVGLQISATLLVGIVAGGTNIAGGKLVSQAGPRGAAGATGAAGAAGTNGTNGTNGSDGLNAFTTLTSGFTQPAVGATVVAFVVDSTFATVGQYLFVEGGGAYQVTAKAAGQVTLENLYPAPINTAAGGAVATSGQVSPSGAFGEGDVVGPAVAVDDEIVTFNGTTGKLLQGGGIKSIAGALQTIGGNARGTAAVDLQTERGGVTQVASGDYSTVAGGASNRAAGEYSSVLGGDSNVASGIGSTVSGGVSNEASGDWSTVPGGYGNVALQSLSFASGLYAYADKWAQKAFAAGSFSNSSGVGDAQFSELIVRGETTGATPLILYLDGDGAANRMTLASGKSWTFQGIVVGRRDNDDTAHWKFEGGIHNKSGTTALTAAVTASLIAADAGCSATWGQAANVAITADNTNDALQVEVTGVAAQNIRWVCYLKIVEVVY